MGVGRLRGKTKRGCGKDLESFDPHQEVEFPESRDVRRLLKVGCSRAKNKSGETGMKGGFEVCRKRWHLQGTELGWEERLQQAGCCRKAESSLTLSE